MDKLLAILACPVCKASLQKSSEEKLFCPWCKRDYQKIDNLYFLLPQTNIQKSFLPTSNSVRKASSEKLIDWKFLSYQYYIRYQKFTRYVNPIIKDNLVLDVGCASAALSYNFKNYLGLDNSLKLVLFASQHVNKPILLADARYIPLKNHSVPFFVCRNLLEHTSQDLKIIYELKKVVQKGGFFELPCSDQISWALDPINLLLRKCHFAPLDAFSYGYGHINMLSFAQWQEQLRRGGFKVIDTQNIGRGLILNLISLGESLFFSYGDNDAIPAKMVPKKLYTVISRSYNLLEKLDPKITKSWTKLFYVKV